MKVQAVTQTYTESTVLPKDNYGGWMCANVGSIPASVMGYELQPGKGLDFLNVGDAIWSTPISLDIPAGGAIRITRLRFSAGN